MANINELIDKTIKVPDPSAPLVARYIIGMVANGNGQFHRMAAGETNWTKLPDSGIGSRSSRRTTLVNRADSLIGGYAGILMSSEAHRPTGGYALECALLQNGVEIDGSIVTVQGKTGPGENVLVSVTYQVTQ